jgi:hypothetical protein
MGVCDLRHATAAVLPGKKTRYPLYRRLGGSKGRSGRVRKISLPMGLDPRTVHPVTSSYTDWAIPARINSSYVFQIPSALHGKYYKMFSHFRCLRGQHDNAMRATFSAPIYCSLSLHFCQRTAVVLQRATSSVLKSAEIRWYVTVARIEGEVWHGQSIKVGATARRFAHLSLVATLVLRVAPGT